MASLIRWKRIRMMMPPPVDRALHCIPAGSGNAAAIPGGLLNLYFVELSLLYFQRNGRKEPRRSCPFNLPAKDYGIMAVLLRRPATLRDLFRFLLLLYGTSFLLSFYPFFF